MIFGKEETAQFNKETKCWICKGELNDDKVRDHCHFTGRYRGAAHNKCNLNYNKPNFTPGVFHNLSGYDTHLFIKNRGFTAGNIDCIPNNEEKYISFTKNIDVGTYMNKKGETKPINHKIRFIDSFKFMGTSLDSLVNNLPETAFNNLKRYYTRDKFNLVKRKGVYPYEYMDSLERFNETKLPPKEAFYSRLTGEDISDEDYAHAQNVWRVFEIFSSQTSGPVGTMLGRNVSWEVLFRICSQNLIPSKVLVVRSTKWNFSAIFLKKIFSSETAGLILKYVHRNVPWVTLLNILKILIRQQTWLW